MLSTSAKSVFELRLHCPDREVETLVEKLEAAGALSVSIEDADAGTASESALFGEPGMGPPAEGWRRSRILALFETRQDAAAAASGLPRSSALSLSEVPDQDWVRLTQAQFAPVEIASGFWIVPSWHEPSAAARTIIRLDPGLAFGTGTHPTTRMCLRFIARSEGRFARVLDYGCGSGILAIAAAKFGAREVDAVDIDEAAVDAAQANADENKVRIRTGLPDLAIEQYDLVLANILASPLKVLAPLLCSRVAPGGALVLAGILERQAAELIDAYASNAKLTVSDVEDGWILMTASP